MKIIFLVVILTFVYLFGMIQLENYRTHLLLSYSSSSSYKASSPTSPSSHSSVLITVTIEGDVKRPGAIEVVPGTLLQEVLTLCGGLLETADARATNANYVVQEGDVLYIPSRGEETKVSINTGSTAQLDSLPGIGYVTATRIIDYRTTHGDFMTIESLMDVTGIGITTYTALRDLIIL